MRRPFAGGEEGTARRAGQLSLLNFARQSSVARPCDVELNPGDRRTDYFAVPCLVAQSFRHSLKHFFVLQRLADFQATVCTGYSFLIILRECRRRHCDKRNCA
jgi:hypothetical protein